MSFNCYHCKGRHDMVAEARKCANVAATRKKGKRIRSPRRASTSAGDHEPWVGMPSLPNDSELHKLIGPTQNYNDDT